MSPHLNIRGNDYQQEIPTQPPKEVNLYALDNLDNVESLDKLLPKNKKPPNSREPDSTTSQLPKLATRNSRKSKREIYYPESDGKRMAYSTFHARVMVTIYHNLSKLFAQHFVAIDLLWYPIENNKKKSLAPDIMVALGRPRKDVGCYKQWEQENVPPQVVFEILSPGNRPKEMKNKLEFYEQYGVQEYYLYDPEKQIMQGYIREGTRLETIPTMESWQSPLLKIWFRTNETSNWWFYLPNGQPFLTYEEIDKNAEFLAKWLEVEKRRVEAEARRAEAESQRAEAATQRAETATQRAETAEAREVAERQQREALESKLVAMAAKLRALGLEVD
jgi:Uma2 family endonuclease